MHVEWVSESASTNAELVQRASAADLDDFTVLATTNQTAGRGRLGRSWVSPPGTTIAVSVFLRPGDGMPWLSLLAGLAMTRAVRSLLPGQSVGLKWPNDVQVDGLKVSGLLGEIVPTGGAVIGAGLNLTMTEDQLPVPTATSLTLRGADATDLPQRAIDAYLEEFDAQWRAFAASGFDPEAGLRGAVAAACGTLGREVRVELPDRSQEFGVAESIDELGRLIVLTGGGRRTVAAGDVTHLRHA